MMAKKEIKRKAYQGYRFIKGLKSDVIFEAEGSTLKEVFENAALALLSVICQIDKVSSKKTEEFEMKGENIQELMFNFLSGIIAVVDTESMFFSKVIVEKVDEHSVRAKLFGEDMTPEKGETVVKAVTNYNYKFEKKKDGYKVTVALDI